MTALEGWKWREKREKREKENPIIATARKVALGPVAPHRTEEKTILPPRWLEAGGRAGGGAADIDEDVSPSLETKHHL